MISDECLTVSCPKCKARKDQPCVYMSSNLWHEKDRVGKPTQRPHNERMNRYERRLRKEHVVARRPQPHPALASLWQFEKSELEATRQWLKRNWKLFYDLGDGR